MRLRPVYASLRGRAYMADAFRAKTYARSTLIRYMAYNYALIYGQIRASFFLQKFKTKSFSLLISHP